MSTMLALADEAIKGLRPLVLGIEPKTFNGQPDRTKDGVPKHSVKVILDGGTGDVVTVTVATDNPPTLVFGQPVTFTGLRIGAYNGNLWFAADSIEVIQ